MPLFRISLYGDLLHLLKNTTSMNISQTALHFPPAFFYLSSFSSACIGPTGCFPPLQVIPLTTASQQEDNFPAWLGKQVCVYCCGVIALGDMLPQTKEQEIPVQ